MVYSTGESGIKSLAGFAYQIKVLIYYLALLQKNQQIEFETLEDVNIRSFETSKIDNYSDSYKCIMGNIEGNIAIQVKRTSISSITAEKILYNWLITEKNHSNVNRYILFTDKEYGNEDNVFEINAEELFNKINNSNKKANSLITRVKNMFDANLEEFKNIYNSIKNKYEFKSIEEIDNEILNRYEERFQRGGIPEVIYYMRIQELMRYITEEIMKSVSEGKPFICTYDKFIKQIVEICRNIDEDEPVISYSSFKKNNTIDWEDLEVINSREYIQLSECNLPRKSIENHLMYKIYYESLKCSYMENNRVRKIDEI